jgi:hypothetical protein
MKSEMKRERQSPATDHCAGDGVRNEPSGFGGDGLGGQLRPAIGDESDPDDNWLNESTNAGAGGNLILNVLIEPAQPQKYLRFWVY